MLSYGKYITDDDIESNVSRWSPQRFASFCNVVVWASASRQGTILPSFTEQIFVKDKGIDAEYIELACLSRNPSHLIGLSWNVLQYKLRDVFAQDRKKILSGLKNELQKARGKSSQGAKRVSQGALKDVYERNGYRPVRYAFFTNVKLTLAEKKALKAIILKGYDQPESVEVVVNGAADLAVLLNDLPHIRLAYFDTSRFCPWEQAWISLTHSGEQPRRGAVKLIGRNEQLTTLKSYIDDQTIRTIVLAGPSGIGKSRLALEATKQRQTATVVTIDPASMYASDVLAAETPNTETIIIIEDPDPKRAEEFVRLTLDHLKLKLVITLPTAENTPAPNFGLDERVRTIRVEPLTDQQARELLKAADAKFDFSVESWIISQAGGNPGILLAAASVPDLRKSSISFSESVALAFERKIRQKLGDRSCEALRLLSLMTRVSIHGPEYDELAAVLRLFSSGLQLNDLINEIWRLELAGVVRVRGEYVEVVPSLLANYLTTSVLKGRYQELALLFVKLKRPARFRLIERLRETRGSEAAHFWDELFSSTDLFADFETALTNIQLLRLVAGAAAGHVARLLENGLSAFSLEARRSIAWNVKRNLMAILEELLFRNSTCAGALRCLAMLAEAEVGTNDTTATIIFCECFHPDHPQYPLSVGDRLQVLRHATSEESSLEMRKIGLQAVLKALSIGWSFDLRQGGGSEPLATTPTMTYGDVSGYREAMLDILFAMAQSNHSELAELAQTSLPSILAQYTFSSVPLGLPRLRQAAQWCVTKQLHLSASPLARALLDVQHRLEHLTTDNPEVKEKIHEAICEVVNILAYLESGDFSLRLMRWAGTWGEDEHAMELRVLASEVIDRPGLLPEDLLNWLISDEAVLSWPFFQTLGECDTNHCWLSRVEQMGATKKGVFAFSAYFAGLSVVNGSFVNRRLNELTEEGMILGEAIARASGNLPGDLAGVERVKKLWNDKKVHITIIEFYLLRRALWINVLNVEEYLQLLESIVGNEHENAMAVVNSFNTWLYAHPKINGKLAEFALDCLEKAIPGSLEDAYRCDHLASRLAEQNAESGFQLFDTVLKLLNTSTVWNPLSPYTGPEFWNFLRKADRRRAVRMPLSLATSDTAIRPTITISCLETIDQENDAAILAEFAKENKEQAKVVCECLAAKKAGFWSIAFEIYRQYPKDRSVRASLENAVMRTGYPISVLSGLPLVELQSNIENIQRASSEMSLSADERSWLERVENILQGSVERLRQQDINMRAGSTELVEEDPEAPERLWKIRDLLLSGQLGTLRKVLSRDELLSLLPRLQLSNDEATKFEEQIKRWEQ